MKPLAFLSLLLLTTVIASAAQSTWVYYDASNHLAYQTWGNGNRIMDFSYAGYMGGGVALPNVATVQTLNPSGGDDTTALQSAINSVGSRALVNGFRGALQLGAGTFHVSAQINVASSGVVVRGAGSGAGGTVIQMTAPSEFTLFYLAGSGSPSESGSVNITDTYVPSGTNGFSVSSASGFNIGDLVMVHRPVTSNWIAYLGMDKLVRNGATQTWISAGSTITTDRSIKQISGNQITLDVPLTDSFDSQYLGTPVGTMAHYSWSSRISQVGLEHLAIQAPATTNAYISVHLNNLIDSWVRDVAIQDGVNCFNLDKQTKRITIDSVSITHTVNSTISAAPSDFACTGTQIFFNNCSAYGSGNWPFVTHVTGTGPIVVLNFYTTEKAGISPHQRWCTGILADGGNIPNAPSGTQGIAFRNRGTAGSGQGWACGWAVAWNVTTPYFLVSAAPGTESWCIGGVGAMTSRAGNGDPDGIYDSLGTHVTLGQTGSLYLEQLRQRLGDAALANIGYGVADFTLAAAPASASVLTGNGTNFTVSIGSLSGFSNNVTLGVSGLPANTGFSFTPPIVTNGTGTSTLTITTLNSTPAGNYPLTIIGAGGGAGHTAAVSLVVMNFSLAAAPASQSVTAGSNVSYTITAATNSSFTGTIQFGLSGLPANIGFSFVPPSLSGAGTATLNITTTSNAPAGNYPLTIFGTNGSIATASANLVISGVAAGPGTLLWNPPGADTNWSTVLNWTNISAGGFGPPGANNSVLFTNYGAVANSALAAPGSGVVVPSRLNTIANGSFTITALTNYANAVNTTPLYHNLALPGGASLTISGGSQVGSSTLFDFGANNVTLMSISGAGAALHLNGSLTVSQNSGSTGVHNAVLDLSGLDTFTMNTTQIRLGVEGGGTTKRACGTIWLARTNSLTLTSAGYSDSTGAGSPSSGNPALYLGHNTSAFGVGSQMFLGVSNSIFMDYATIGRGETNALLAFNPAFLGASPSVFIRGISGGSTRVGVYVVGDGSSGSVNTAPSTNDFSGGTVDALINYLCVGRGRNASSTVGGYGILTFDSGSINANALVIGLVYPPGSNSPAIGVVNVGSAAVLTVNSNLVIAQSPNVPGQTAFPQGTLNVTGGLVQATNITGGGGTSTIALQSGTIDCQGGSLANVSSLSIGAPGVSDSATLANAAVLSVSNAITIASNGVLAGGITITAPALTVNGLISPGVQGIGVTTQNGPAAFGAGGGYAFAVLDANGAPGVGTDFLQVNGTLDIQSTASTPFTIHLQSLGPGGPAAVPNFSADTNYDWTIASATGGLLNFDPSKFAIDTTQFQNDLMGGYYYLHDVGNSLVLFFTNNHPPVAGIVTLYRSTDTLRIPLSALTPYWSDPDGDPVTLADVNPSSLNVIGVTNVSADAFYIYYTNANHAADTIMYDLADVRTNPPAVYRDNDTVRTAQGRINLIPPPSLTAASAQSGNNLVLAGTGGIPNSSYYLLTSTNLTLPLPNWTRLSTNAFDNAGQFRITNSINSSVPRQFYLLQLP